MPRPQTLTAGHVFPHAVQDETDASSFSGSVVPSWSQRSIRCPPLVDSMCTVNVSSYPLGPDGVRRPYAIEDLSETALLSRGPRPRTVAGRVGLS